MNPPQILDSSYSWPANQKQQITLSPITLPIGRTLADFATFILTIRTDPLFPRSGTDLNAVISPEADGWTVATTASGSVVGATVVFDFNVPTLPGQRRYVFDARAEGGTGGPVALIPATWLSVSPRVGTP